MSKQKTSLRQLALTGAGIAALATAIWLPGLVQQGQLQGDIQLPEPDCEITAPGCKTQQDQLSVAMQLDSGRVRAATPLTFTVELENIPAQSVMVDLQGKDMYMGINQIQLSPVEGNPGTWQGSTELAVCVTGEMTWQARVLAATDDARISTQFRFQAK